MSRFATLIKIGIGLWIAMVTLAMFLWVPAHEGLGNVGRIVIMHVPTGWLTMLAFLVSAVYSALFLRSGRVDYDSRALAATEIGFVFSVLSTVTGSIFAKAVWGTFWNWDPRETAIAVLLLIYAAYFALRSSVTDPLRQRRLSAIYALLAFVTVPFLVFIIPRITDSTLHPNCAILNTPSCEGVVLAQNGRLQGQVDDFRIKLVDLQESNQRLVAIIEVRNPSNGTITTLQPSFDLQQQVPLLIERVPDTLREIQIKRVIDSNGDVQVEIALANLGNIGLLSEPRTLITFWASLGAFTALFFWLWWLRALLLTLAAQLQQELAV